MTQKQYKKLKRAARRDAHKDLSGIGWKRTGDYIVVYSTYSGFDAYKSPVINTHMQANLYKYVSSCRKLAQLDPATAAQQLADCKAFLEAYKK